MSLLLYSEVYNIEPFVSVENTYDLSLSFSGLIKCIQKAGWLWNL